MSELIHFHFGVKQHAVYVSFISPQLSIFKHTFIVDFYYKQVAGFFHLYPFMIESCVLCQHSDYLQIFKPIMHTINDTFRPSSEVSPCSHTLLIYCNNIYNYNKLYKKLSIDTTIARVFHQFQCSNIQNLSIQFTSGTMR